MHQINSIHVTAAYRATRICSSISHFTAAESNHPSHVGGVRTQTQPALHGCMLSRDCCGGANLRGARALFAADAESPAASPAPTLAPPGELIHTEFINSGCNLERPECASVEVNKCLVCTRREGAVGRLVGGAECWRGARTGGRAADLRFNKCSGARFVWAEICSSSERTAPRRVRASRQLQTKRSVNVLRRPAAPTFYLGCEF